jgi:hypothetical protein
MDFKSAVQQILSELRGHRGIYPLFIYSNGFGGLLDQLLKGDRFLDLQEQDLTRRAFCQKLADLPFFRDSAKVNPAIGESLKRIEAMEQVDVEHFDWVYADWLHDKHVWQSTMEPAEVSPQAGQA